MKKHQFLLILSCLTSLFFTGSAHAIFIDAGDGMVYDTELGVTWLKDANNAKTSGFDSDGLMNWNDATAWAASLTVGGVSGWRLPTMNTSNPRPGTGFAIAAKTLPYAIAQPR